MEALGDGMPGEPADCWDDLDEACWDEEGEELDDDEDAEELELWLELDELELEELEALGLGMLCDGA